MKTKIIRRRGFLALVLDAPEYSKDDRPVLAAGTEIEGTGCWIISDIRLTPKPILNRYACSISAEDVMASFKPDSTEVALMAKALLREFDEAEDGTLSWCTFRNFLKGECGVRGYTPVSGDRVAPPIYHPRLAVINHLNQAQLFWSAFEGDVAQSTIVNPHAQPRESAVSFVQTMADITRKKRLASAQGDDTFPDP